MIRNNAVIAFISLALAAGFCQCSTPVSEPQVVGLADLQRVLAEPGEEIKVINFWATWCAPCIKEMPLFEKLGEEREDVRVTLVSLDLDLDPDPEKVRRFVKQRNIHLPVLILDAGNPNEWIEKVDAGWSGALPTTMIINGATGKRLVVERELHEGDLEKLIEQVR